MAPALALIFDDIQIDWRIYFRECSNTSSFDCSENLMLEMLSFGEFSFVLSFCCWAFLGCPVAFKNEALGGSQKEALGGFSREGPGGALKRIHWMAFEKEAPGGL